MIGMNLHRQIYRLCISSSVKSWQGCVCQTDIVFPEEILNNIHRPPILISKPVHM